MDQLSPPICPDIDSGFWPRPGDSWLIAGPSPSGPVLFEQARCEIDDAVMFVVNGAVEWAQYSRYVVVTSATVFDEYKAHIERHVKQGSRLIVSDRVLLDQTVTRAIYEIIKLHPQREPLGVYTLDGPGRPNCLPGRVAPCGGGGGEAMQLACLFDAGAVGMVGMEGWKSALLPEDALILKKQTTCGKSEAPIESLQGVEDYWDRKLGDRTANRLAMSILYPMLRSCCKTLAQRGSAVRIYGDPLWSPLARDTMIITAPPRRQTQTPVEPSRPSDFMRFVIACPGPSLSEWTPAERRELFDGAIVMAVNSAAGAAPCDYWVGVDPAAFNIPRDPINVRIGMLSISQNLRQCQRLTLAAPRLARWGQIVAESYMLPHRDDPGLNSGLTSLFAVAMAYRLGADQIDVIGMDCDGDRDCFGDRQGGRNDSRWKDELTGYKRLVEFLEEHGVKIRRLKTPEPAALATDSDCPTCGVMVDRQRGQTGVVDVGTPNCGCGERINNE